MFEVEDNVVVPDSSVEPSQPTEAQPAPEVATAPEGQVTTPEKVEPQLYELPDGRKVDADTLTREWKENFYPEFTRKSQELADIKKVPEPVPEWKQEGWQPQTYEELIEVAKREALGEIQKSAQLQQQQREAMESAINAELSEIKKENPKLDENKLFEHASKFGFPSLKNAYRNMSEIEQRIKLTEERVIKNMKGREAEPIATTPASQVGSSNEIDYDDFQNNSHISPLEYLARLKK